MKMLNLIYFVILFSLVACIGADNTKGKEGKLVNELSALDLEKGEQLYRAKCMNCHMKTGVGIVKFYPPLANSDFLRKNTVEAIRMVKYGSNKPIKVNGIKYNSLMPSSGLTDKELVLVFNYILNSWGNNYGIITLKDVEMIKR